MALKPKNLPQSSGAENLAAIMVDLGSEGKEKLLQQIALEQLFDAPIDWNFFKPLSGGKFYELLESIQSNGILVPLIVWERDQGCYMILSGHNRKRAAEKLYKNLGDRSFSSIPCKVYRHNEINEEQARGILIDCNWVQRILSPAERAKAIQHKYVELGRQKRGVGKRGYDLIAEHFGLKSTQVYQYNRLATLEKEWLQKLDDGKISIKAGVHLARLSISQRKILLQIGTELTNAYILSVDPSWTNEQIQEQYSQSNKPTRKLQMTIPSEKYDEIIKAIEIILKSN